MGVFSCSTTSGGSTGAPCATSRSLVWGSVLGSFVCHLSLGKITWDVQTSLVPTRQGTLWQRWPLQDKCTHTQPRTHTHTHTTHTSHELRMAECGEYTWGAGSGHVNGKKHLRRLQDKLEEEQLEQYKASRERWVGHQWCEGGWPSAPL